jgi:CRP/FNR family transcriptional regulator, cyclic AMP receptor protein
MGSQMKLEIDQILIKEGEHSNSMYWVQSGQLVVVKKRGNEEVVLGHIFSGELVGEISFLDKESRSATVKAMTECDLIEIPQETLDKVFKSQPKWLEILVKTLAERLRKANARIKV